MFQAEKLVEENGDKIPDNLKSDLEAKIADIKDILENDRENIDRIKPAHEALMQSLQAAGAAMYQAAGGDGEGPDMSGFDASGTDAGAGATAGDDTTVEGEFREVNDDENKN